MYILMLFLLDWIKSRTALDSGSLKAFVPLYSSLQVLLLLPEKIYLLHKFDGSGVMQAYSVAKVVHIRNFAKKSMIKDTRFLKSIEKDITSNFEQKTNSSRTFD